VNITIVWLEIPRENHQSLQILLFGDLSAAVWKQLCAVEQILQTAQQVTFVLGKHLQHRALMVINVPSSDNKVCKDYISKTPLEQACLEEAGQCF